MMQRTERPHQDWREIVTVAMRLVAFGVTLAVICAFSLPWVRLDGMQEVYSGVALPVLAISPVVEYLFAVAPVQTGVLIGCPVVIILFAVIVAGAYAQRRTAIWATVIVLASAIAIIYGTQDLVDSSGPGKQVGLSTVVVLSAVLLAHQLLIKLRTKLLQDGRLPSIYRSLSIITGTGYYRWRET
jgi:hypothetical protein